MFLTKKNSFNSYSFFPFITAAKLKALGTHVFVIAVGNAYDSDELMKIASKDGVYFTDNFKELAVAGKPGKPGPADVIKGLICPNLREYFYEDQRYDFSKTNKQNYFSGFKIYSKRSLFRQNRKLSNCRCQKTWGQNKLRGSTCFSKNSPLSVYLFICNLRVSL